MRKFITLLVLAVTMLLTLAACQVETPCEHQYYKEITKRPTCVEEGERTCTCKLCGDSYVETIQTTNHKYTSAVTKAATCTETGVKTVSCATCGDSKTQVIAKTSHKYTEKVTTAATCKAEGVKTFTCSDCKDSYTEKIARTSHNITEKVTKAATCKAEGVKTFTCSNCKDSYTEKIAKTSHNYKGKVTTAATCKAEGVKTFTCSDCKDSYTEKIAKTSHNYKGKVTTAATCKAAGVKTYTCSGCGKYYTESIAKLSKHNYVSGYCSWCGTKDPNYVHTYSAGEKWTVPGKFEFTINSVTQHSICSSSNGYNNEIGATTAVIIEYTYKNLGSAKLKIDEWDFEVYDAKGVEGDELFFCIYCDHGTEAQNCISGGSCTVKFPIALINSGSSITIYMDVDGQTATFKINVTSSSNNGGSSNSGSSQNLWSYSDATKLDNYVQYAVNALENAKDSYDKGTVYYGVAASYCRSASGYIKSAIELLESKAELKFTDGTTMLEEFEKAYEVISGLDNITITYDNATQYKSLISTTSYTGAVKASGLRILTTKLLAEF